MAPQLVQLSLPGSHSIVSVLLQDANTTSVQQLIHEALSQDGDQLQLCPTPHDGHEKDIRRWGLQRALASKPNRHWTREELARLEEGLVPLTYTVSQALAEAGSGTQPSPPPDPQKATPTPQLSDFVLTGHLHRPLLRLVYLPLRVNVTFLHVPEIPQDWRFALYTGAGMTAGEGVEAVVEELGIKRVVAHGAKTSRVEYALQVSDPSKVAPQALPFTTKLIPRLLNQLPPYEVIFTISPAWLARAGTLAHAINAPKTRAAAQGAAEDGGWRPGSIWGGLWGGGGQLVEISDGSRSRGVEVPKLIGAHPELEEQESEGEGEPTIKGKISTDSFQAGDGNAATGTNQSSARARLSTLFTDWVGHSDDPVLSRSSATKDERTKIVSGPVAIVDSKEFESLVSPALASESEDEPSDSAELNASLEALMDELGMKPLQREAMRRLPRDRKRFLVSQHLATSMSSQPPLRASKTGPEPYGDVGGFSGLKRFSLWGAPSLPVLPKNPPPRRPVTTYEASASDPATSTTSPDHPDSVSTPGSPRLGGPTLSATSWATWWGAASNATGAGHADAVGHQAKDTPQFYVDQIKSTKISQRSLIKHLIALRVRLSTSKLSWSINFLRHAQGLEAIEALLGKIATKEINRVEGQTDEDETVQLECIKCLRVLMNTEIGFERVLECSDLITFIAYSLFTSSNKLRSQVADILAALCVLSLRDGHRVVLTALSDFRVAHEERFRFEYLIESIKLRDMQAEDTEVEQDEDELGLWEYRTAAMSLINAIANSPGDLEERMALRDELTRRGLNEALTGLRYVNPPESFLTQLTVYWEERQEDQEELHERTVERSRADTSDVTLGQLIKLAQGHEDLYPLLVDTVKKYVAVFERQDLDVHLRKDLITVLDEFLNHMIHLENFDEGWRTFMRAYLNSVQHIVGQQAVILGSRIADSATVPTGFLEELEGLRSKVEELSDERASLKNELTSHIAETNMLRSLPLDRGSVDSASERRRSFKNGDQENFSGVIQRLVQKEKQVLELQAELAQLSKPQGGSPEDLAAKKERNERTRRWETLMDEIARHKVQITELETTLETRDKEIQYLKRALESVYSRFQTGVSKEAVPSDSTSSISSVPLRPESLVEPDVMAQRTLEALAKRDEEIMQLRLELASVRAESAARLRLPKAFARPAPSPPQATRAPLAKVTTLVSVSSNEVSSTLPLEMPQCGPPPPPPPPYFKGSTGLQGLPVAAMAERDGSYALSSPATSIPVSAPHPSAPAPFLSGENDPVSTPPPPPPPPPPMPRKSEPPGPKGSNRPSLAPLPPPPPPPPSSPPTGSSSPPAPPPPAPKVIPRQHINSSVLSPKPVKKLKQLFWTKIPDTSLSPTVWGNMKLPSSIDLSDLERTFSVGAPAGVVIVNESSSNQKKPPASLLGLARAQNIAIMLSRFKLKHTQIRDAVLHFDDTKLTIENLKAIRQYVPTADEAEAIRAFDGDFTLLAVADQYFNKMLVIPRLAERLSCMLLRRRLELEMEEIKPDLTILRSAADELRHSSKFKQILSTVLMIGNTLNAGNFMRGNAGGFSLDTLLKLKDTRTGADSSKTPTLLHYLVRVLERVDSSLVTFLDDAPHIEAASRLSVSTVLAAVQTLVAGVAAVQEEVRVMKRMRKSPPEDRFIPLMESFSQQAVPAIDALKILSTKLEQDLRNLVVFYGEDPAAVKAEDVFGLVVTFSAALQRAQGEVKTSDVKTRPSSPQKSETPEKRPTRASVSSVVSLTVTEPCSDGRSSIGRGGFDDAIRDLRSGTTRRQRSTANHRPLSRIFHDGAR